MVNPDDIPQFPYPKPREIEKIEQLPPEIIHAMRRVEMEEKIHDAALSLVATYWDHAPKKTANFEECLMLVTGALNEIGSSISGQLGLLFVALSSRAAEEACREFIQK